MLGLARWNGWEVLRTGTPKPVTHVVGGTGGFGGRVEGTREKRTRAWWLDAVVLLIRNRASPGEAQDSCGRRTAGSTGVWIEDEVGSGAPMRMVMINK